MRKHLYGILAGVVVIASLALAVASMYILSQKEATPAIIKVDAPATPVKQTHQGRVRADIRYNSTIAEFEWLRDGKWEVCKFEDALVKEGDIISTVP